jgi:MFS family permease
MEKPTIASVNDDGQLLREKRGSISRDSQDSSRQISKSYICDEEVAQSAEQAGPVTWLSLPRKDQLAILFLCRLVDFLQVASLQAYVFYQLKSFDPSLSDSAISTQAGILQGCFTGAQVLTAILWGKVADASSGGRKLVLLIGLGGTAVSCLGYGFSTTFWQAALFRILGGGINGTVGIMFVFGSQIGKFTDLFVVGQ